MDYTGHENQTEYKKIENYCVSLPQRSGGTKAIDHIINFNRSPEILLTVFSHIWHHNTILPRRSAGTEASILIRVWLHFAQSVNILSLRNSNS